MSNQDPYGQPPQQPNQGWQQPQQPYGGEYGGGYGPGYGAPPPPKKSRTGLVIGLVVLVLLLGAGVVGAVVLAGGDEEDKGGSTTKGSELSGETLEGEGYTYELPEDWQEATDEAKSSGSPGTIDTVSVWGKKLDGARANVIVEASAGNIETPLEDLRETWESNMSGAAGSDPMPQDGTTIGGEEAIGARFERDNEAGVPIVQIAYLTVHDGTAYSIILSSQEKDAERAGDLYDAMLGSWEWE